MLSLLDRVPAFDLLPIIVHSAWYGYITSIFLHTIRPPSKMVHESIQVPWRKPHGVCLTPFTAGKWEQGIKKKWKNARLCLSPVSAFWSCHTNSVSKTLEIITSVIDSTQGTPLAPFFLRSYGTWHKGFSEITPTKGTSPCDKPLTRIFRVRTHGNTGGKGKYVIKVSLQTYLRG